MSRLPICLAYDPDPSPNYNPNPNPKRGPGPNLNPTYDPNRLPERACLACECARLVVRPGVAMLPERRQPKVEEDQLIGADEADVVGCPRT